MTGESGSFSDFYAASSPRLLGVLVAVTGDLGCAEDALQEAYVRAAQRWRSLDDPQQWVLRVAVNAARDEARRTRRRARAHQRHGVGPDGPEPSPLTVLVVQALRGLPREQREALALHYLLDMSVERVAAQLDRPVGTVKAQLSRGRARLALVLDSERTCRA